MVGVARGRGRGSKWSRLSDNQQRELRDMKKRQRSENKKKKVLKMDSEGVIETKCSLKMCNVLVLSVLK